jgi:hypothetical protein
MPFGCLRMHRGGHLSPAGVSKWTRARRRESKQTTALSRPPRAPGKLALEESLDVLHRANLGHENTETRAKDKKKEIAIIVTIACFGLMA